MRSFLSAPVSVLGIFVFSLFVANGAWADTALDKSMQQLGKAYKELANDLKQPDETKKSEYLALAATMKDQAKAAHDLEPKLAKTLPPDQRDNMTASYRKDMDKFAQDIDGLSDALNQAKWDDARKLMETLKQDMFSGHKQYRVQKHHEEPAAQTPATNAPAQ